ncbi:DUF667 domain-containing protein [archaeon]|nr:MAG: DUF667 domain-containing protein [archaeon]
MDTTYASRVEDEAGGGSPSSSPAAISLVALLPPSMDIDLATYPPILHAMDTAAAAKSRAVKPDHTAEVFIVHDAELDTDVVDVFGRDVTLLFPCRVSLPQLVLHFRTQKFFDIELHILDTAEVAHHLLISNRQTRIRVASDATSLPLATLPGWNRVVLDLVSLTRAAFHADFGMVTGVIVHSSVTLAHIYFQAQEFADSQLPPFLQSIKSGRTTDATSPLPSSAQAAAAPAGAAGAASPSPSRMGVGMAPTFAARSGTSSLPRL